MTVAFSSPAPLTHLKTECAFVHAHAQALAERSDPATQAARLHAVASALRHLLNRRWAATQRADARRPHGTRRRHYVVRDIAGMGPFSTARTIENYPSLAWGPPDPSASPR